MLTLVAAAVAAGAWLALLAFMAVATRPQFGAALPATMDIGPESPAVAAFLVHRWRAGPDAIPATLLDLAGRDLVDIERIAPEKYLLRPVHQLPDEAALTPYERRVWEHVRGKVSGGVLPAAALDLGVGSRAKSWTADFGKEVIADARARGLCRARWSTQATAVLLGTALIPAALLGYAWDQVPREPGEESPFFVGLVFGWAALALLFRRLRSERDTAAGRAAAGRWLGLRDYLGSNPAFPGMSPAAEAIWDRYLAYAAAFGLARTAVTALPIRAEDPEAAWSAYSGRWRLVRLRWPGGFFRPGSGMLPAVAAGIGLACLAIGGTVAWRLGPVINDDALTGLRSRVREIGWEPLGIIGTTLIAAGNLIVAAVLIRGALLLWRALPDLFGRTEMVGEVLRVRSITNDDSTSWFVVLDDGHSSRLEVWRVTADIAGAAREGTEMRASVARRLGHVYSIAPAEGRNA